MEFDFFYHDRESDDLFKREDAAEDVDVSVEKKRFKNLMTKILTQQKENESRERRRCQKNSPSM